MKTLNLNSQGKEVIALQKFLHIKATGIFCTITEKHVRSWQSAHGLTPHGFIDPITYHAMLQNGLTPEDTTILEALEIKEHFLPQNAYFKNPLHAEPIAEVNAEQSRSSSRSKSRSKKWIFLHHTRGWHNPYRVINSWGKRPQQKVATEYVIGGQSIHNDNFDYDGEIVHAIPNNGWAWHLQIGNQQIHRESIGIELCNFGYLTKGYFEKRENNKLQSIERKKNSYYTYVGQEVHRDQVATLNRPFRNYTHFHKYSSKQIQSLKSLLKIIGNQHDIDIRKGLPELIKKHGTNAFDKLDVQMCINNPGIWSHTNVIGHKYDVSPQEELIEMLLCL